MCSNKPNNLYKLKAPCKDCPFRSDGAFVGKLGKRRIEGIVENIRNDGFFPCHKTVNNDDYDLEDDITLVTDGKPRGKESFCAGALAMLEATNETLNHRVLRMDIYFGNYVPSNIKLVNAPVFTTWESLIKYHSY